VLDLKAIREDPEAARAALARRGAAESLDELLALDTRRRELLPEIENGKARQNRASEEIQEAKKSGGDAEAVIAEMRELAPRIKELESELGEIQEKRDEVAARIPNLPDPDAPDGMREEDAVVLHEVGEVPQFDFEPLDHLEIGTAMGLINMEAAARASGSRFAYIMGELVLVELALVRYALDVVGAEGHKPVVPPVLVREETLYGTGFLPGDRDQIYELPRDELFLIGTSEVSLAALHAGEILEPGTLPLRYAGFSTCFRREAGAAGKDTRGIFRVHQFDKVEMFSFVEPADAADEHERLLAIEEKILTELEIPYRVVNVAAGDLGAPAAKKYDCEAWIPSQGRYRELTSCSNTTDYQARRLDCRFRAASGEAPVPVNTLNGTAVAIGRTLIALIENRQENEGRAFSLPEILHTHGAPKRIEQ
jgi:seryl-tRNA synthetase